MFQLFAEKVDIWKISENSSEPPVLEFAFSKV